MNRNLGIFIVSGLLLGFSACSSGGGTNPNQADANSATVDFSEFASLIFDDFNGVVTCQNFQGVIDSYTNTPVDCEDGGTVTVTVVSNNCTDGSPFTAEATFSAVADNCDETTDFGTITDGSLQLDADFQGNDNGDVMISSSGITVNGLNFDFDNFLVTISGNGSNVTCTGGMSVDGDSCDVASDCNSCAF